MRKIILTIAAVALVLGVGGAASAGTITVTELGSGLTGVSVNVGDPAPTLTLEVFMTTTGNIDTWDAIGNWDGGPNALISNFTTTGFIPGALPSGYNLIAEPLLLGVITQSAANTVGSAVSWAAANTSPLAPKVSFANFKIGEIVITVDTSNAGSTVVSVGDGFANDPGRGLFLGGVKEAMVENAFNVTVSAVPEPGTASLLGLGLVGLVVAGRRSRA